MLLRRCAPFAPLVVILTIVAGEHLAMPTAPVEPPAPPMLTTRVYIPVLDARRASIVCGADTDPADIRVEYITPDASVSTVVETLSLAPQGSGRHVIDRLHPAFASGSGLIRLLATNPNPGTFYAFLEYADVASPVSGAAFLGPSYRVPYAPMADRDGGQRIRLAITNPNTADVFVTVTNIGSASTSFNLSPLNTVVWDSAAVGQMVNSKSALRIVSTGGDVSVTAAISRGSTTTYFHPSVYGI